MVDHMRAATPSSQFLLLHVGKAFQQGCSSSDIRAFETHLEQFLQPALAGGPPIGHYDEGTPTSQWAIRLNPASDFYRTVCQGGGFSVPWGESTVFVGVTAGRAARPEGTI
jgi:hypothetical protein